MNNSICVVIINWNHGHYLKGCLDALQNQSYPFYRIIVVDNQSTDGSPEWIEQNYPKVQLRRSGANIGFSQAFNLTVRSTTDPFILSLNPDVTVRPNFLAELIQAMNADERIGIVTPKLLRADDARRIDSTGLFIDRRRRTYDRGQGEIDLGQYDRQCEVFGACGAAALYRRKMLNDVSIGNEYFDEDFFAYYEDADLSWRAQLKGWRAVYAPKAVGEHVRGWGDTLRKQRGKSAFGPRLALRNRYLMVVKNDTLFNCVYDIPLILAAELPRLVYILLVNPPILQGLADFVRIFPSAWKKRQFIQKFCITDHSIIRRKYFMAGGHGAG